MADELLIELRAVEKFLILIFRRQIDTIILADVPYCFRRKLVGVRADIQCFEDMKPEQICRIIRKNIKQTYNLLARGKEALRLAYERMGLSRDS